MLNKLQYKNATESIHKSLSNASFSICFTCPHAVKLNKLSCSNKVYSTPCLKKRFVGLSSKQVQKLKAFVTEQKQKLGGVSKMAKKNLKEAVAKANSKTEQEEQNKTGGGIAQQLAELKTLMAQAGQMFKQPAEQSAQMPTPAQVGDQIVQEVKAQPQTVATQTAAAEAAAAEEQSDSTIQVMNRDGTPASIQRLNIRLSLSELTGLGYDGQIVGADVIKELKEKLGIPAKMQKQKAPKASAEPEQQPAVQSAETTQTASGFTDGEIKQISGRTMMFSAELNKFVPV